MIDKREQILARIRAILDTVPGIATDSNGGIRGAGRNRDHLTDITARPAVILYDGTEEEIQMDNGPMRSGVQKMKLTPEISIFIGDRSEDVGTRFSTFRAYLMTAILTDSTLISICGGAMGYGGGLDIRYEACEFSAEHGRQREGVMTLRMSFTYAFRLSDLMAA